jgi:uncharacterized protein (TIGR04255 family)
MERRVLSKKPLVKAIFQITWELPEIDPKTGIYPHYKLLVGRIYDRIKEDYPHHEELPTATMPDEMSAYNIQHLFRKEDGKWPLIGVGPGIIILEDTENYVWDDFKERILNLTNLLYDLYKDLNGNFKINGSMLRYIDAIRYNYNKNVFDFIKNNMKTDIHIYDELFANQNVNPIPHYFDLMFTYELKKPKGAIHLRFTRGIGKDKNKLIWETVVNSLEQDAPNSKKNIMKWAEQAHDLTDEWFFKIIEGKLAKRFD